MSLATADLLVVRARQLLTPTGPGPVSGPRQGRIRTIEDGAFAALNGVLVRVGTSRSVIESVAPSAGAEIFDLEGRLAIVPGFVDPHTHALYAGDRRNELRRRLAGETYAEIAASGGGILATVAATRGAPEAVLVEQTRARLDEMLACGTTTCEIKSGYGLSTESELKMLRAIRTLSGSHPMSISSTFLGAHEVPPEFRGARHRYVDLVVHEMIPAAAAGRLADWCDVFCEEGVFTPAESRRVLEAGLGAGLKARIHAEEFGASGGAAVAAAIGARTADHLVHVTRAGVDALARAGTAATLLPAAAFYLRLGRFAPARELIAGGVPVALGTDVNPGGGLSPGMPFAMALACFGMGLTFEEALAAATLNAAWTLDRAHEAGTLEAGKLADAVAVDGDAVNLLRVGASSIRAVVKRGRVVRGSLRRATEGASLP